MKYTATDIGTPGGKYTLSGIATMNASGQVASSWVGPNFGNELGHAFLYTPGSGFKDLGNIGDDVQVYAQNINDAGQVVGYADNSSQNPNTPDAFLYSTDPMTNLTPPSTYYSGTASGINNSGQVVGYLRVGQFDTPNAFVYSGGTIQTLGGFGGQATDSEAYAINASGQIVGSAAAGSGYHAFLYSGGTMQDLGVLPGFAVSRASAVNSSGQVVGICNNFVGLPITYQGFLYSGGKMQNIATLAGTSVYTMTPKSINDAGQIVGQMQQAVGNNTHAFVYASGGLYDLNDITTGLNGVVLDEAGTIINNGSIVASGVNNGTEHVMVLTPVSGSKAATAIRTSARR